MVNRKERLMEVAGAVIIGLTLGAALTCLFFVNSGIIPDQILIGG